MPGVDMEMSRGEGMVWWFCGWGDAPSPLFPVFEGLEGCSLIKPLGEAHSWLGALGIPCGKVLQEGREVIPAQLLEGNGKCPTCGAQIHVG